ncbi:hypothetical protein [Lacticaseibacillus absianus]|uniref:hypothetical protein n=1 Tax=Lacticaseibacillus absianus TaxID=2729623 RepID=UPI0015C7E278|nr:hypothetical protein [Lacticaseibacillus absianus]
MEFLKQCMIIGVSLLVLIQGIAGVLGATEPHPTMRRQCLYILLQTAAMIGVGVTVSQYGGYRDLVSTDADGVYFWVVLGLSVVLWGAGSVGVGAWTRWRARR